MGILRYEAGKIIDSNGRAVSLSETEISALRRMAPMGRKVAARRWAMERGQSQPGNPEAESLLFFSQLPLLEWGFEIK